MHFHFIKWILLIPVFFLLSFTEPTESIINFCNYFKSENPDGCKNVLNEYFRARQQLPFQHKEYYERFPEIDTLIQKLSKLPCVDSCFFRYERDFVMKTNPPMTDVIIYKINSSDTLKYVLRIMFDEPMKAVWIRKWEN